MNDVPGDATTDALRDAAVLLASRIRIALPYRPATWADVRAVDAELARLRGAGLAEGDEAVVELTNLRATLEILAIGSPEA